MKKIPLTFWAVAIISAAIILTYYIELSTSQSNKIGVATNIITILGVFFVALQINKQSKESIISTEFLNQPNFEFLGLFKEQLKSTSPGYCSDTAIINYNKCTDLHWFDFKQVGNLPARKVKLTLIHNEEKEDFKSLMIKRSVEYDMVYPNDKHQFKLEPNMVPFSHFDINSNGNFFILVDYISAYSKIRYKRVYELSYAPMVPPTTRVDSWDKSIRYFDLTLQHLEDSSSISWNLFFKSKWHQFLTYSGFGKKYTLKHWLIDM